MELGRRLPDEPFEQHGGHSLVPELVHVVEHEHLVACGLLLERLRQHSREHFGARAVLASGERVLPDVDLERIGESARK